MKILARALGAAVVGIMFTLIVGTLLVVKIAQADDQDRRPRP